MVEHVSYSAAKKRYASGPAYISNDVLNFTITSSNRLLFGTLLMLWQALDISSLRIAVTLGFSCFCSRRL